LLGGTAVIEKKKTVGSRDNLWALSILEQKTERRRATSFPKHRYPVFCSSVELSRKKLISHKERKLNFDYRKHLPPTCHVQDHAVLHPRNIHAQTIRRQTLSSNWYVL
jgi:hypothetical protein